MSGSRAAVLEVAGLRRRYGGRGRGDGAGGEAGISDVALTVRQAEVVGVLGVSGAGKTTLARILAGLDTPDAGSVVLAGRSLDLGRRADVMALRRAVQLVFQDPYVSLDPRQSIGAIIGEPLAIRRVAGGPRRERVRALLRSVALPDGGEFARRRPGSLSGGERQRVAIARALACDPAVLVLDEPVSALDVPVRRQIIELLLALRAERRLAMVLITHEPRLAARICDRVSVIQGGAVVDEVAGSELLEGATHPATRELVEASAAAPPSGSGSGP